MATQTPKGYPYPQDSDGTDVPFDVSELALAVDSSPGVSSFTQSEINALGIGEKWAGRVVWNETTATLQFSNGSIFADFDSLSPLADSDPLAVAASASSGTNEVASRSDHVHEISSSLMTLGEWTENTNPTFLGIDIGNGYISERYAKIGRLVVANLWVRWGTTTTTYGQYLRWTPTIGVRHRGAAPTFSALGSAEAWDDSAADAFAAFCYYNEAASTIYFAHTDDSVSEDFWFQTNPFSWGSSDSLGACVFYESAS